MWLARNMDRFWDSWIDWGSAIFLRNCAALGRGVAERDAQAQPASAGPHGPHLSANPDTLSLRLRGSEHHK